MFRARYIILTWFWHNFMTPDMDPIFITVAPCSCLVSAAFSSSFKKAIVVKKIEDTLVVNKSAHPSKDSLSNKASPIAPEEL
jgi:hypothetical protein